MAKRIVIVPGIAVRSYVEEAASALAHRGYIVQLLPAPTWRGVPKVIKSYGSQLAGRVDRAAQPVDLLVGLSVGTQAAAVAAAQSSQVRRLLLVSPMVDPRDRSAIRLLIAWLTRTQKGDWGWRQQLGDWAHAGIPRILAGLLSCVHLDLERILPAFPGAVTIVQPEWNTLSSAAFARDLAERTEARYVEMSKASHSWPVRDPNRFVALIDELVGGAE